MESPWVSGVTWRKQLLEQGEGVSSVASDPLAVSRLLKKPGCFCNIILEPFGFPQLFLSCIN